MTSQHFWCICFISSKNGARGWGYKSGGEEKKQSIVKLKKRGKIRKREKKKNNKT